MPLTGISERISSTLRASIVIGSRTNGSTSCAVAIFAVTMELAATKKKTGTAFRSLSLDSQISDVFFFVP